MKRKNDENLDIDPICNVYSDTTKITNLEITQKVNDALKDAKDSSELIFLNIFIDIYLFLFLNIGNILLIIKAKLKKIMKNYKKI